MFPTSIEQLAVEKVMVDSETSVAWFGALLDIFTLEREKVLENGNLSL